MIIFDDEGKTSWSMMMICLTLCIYIFWIFRFLLVASHRPDLSRVIIVVLSIFNCCQNIYIFILKVLNLSLQWSRYRCLCNEGCSKRALCNPGCEQVRVIVLCLKNVDRRRKEKNKQMLVFLYCVFVNLCFACVKCQLPLASNLQVIILIF